jgi:hypothetical protein
VEVSDVRKRVKETMERAKRQTAERRTRNDEAAREYERFLEGIAVPLFRQIGNVLRAEGYTFTVSTPGGGVRLASDRSGGDYLELRLDTEGHTPQVLIHSSRGRGRRVIDSETPIGAGASIANLVEEDVLVSVLTELEPFVER